MTKLTEFPVHWSSKILTNYKENAITSELHGANKIATNFDFWNKENKNELLHAVYPVKFINDTWLFDETKSLVIRLPFAPKN